MELSEFQKVITDTYGERDAGRPISASIAWLTEELGELAQAIRKGTFEEQKHEVGDVLAWLASVAAQIGVPLEAAAARYADGCPTCARKPCGC